MVFFRHDNDIAFVDVVVLAVRVVARTFDLDLVSVREVFNELVTDGTAGCASSSGDSEVIHRRRTECPFSCRPHGDSMRTEITKRLDALGIERVRIDVQIRICVA